MEKNYNILIENNKVLEKKENKVMNFVKKHF